MAEAAAAAEVAAEEAAAGSEEAVGTTTTDCPAATARERAPQSSETALSDPASEATPGNSLVVPLRQEPWSDGDGTLSTVGRAGSHGLLAQVCRETDGISAGGAADEVSTGLDDNLFVVFVMFGSGFTVIVRGFFTVVGLGLGHLGSGKRKDRLRSTM